MKLLQPLALLANFWFTRKMKGKNAAKVPKVEEPKPEEQKDETKDNEGEEKQEGEKKIKDDKKDE